MSIGSLAVSISCRLVSTAIWRPKPAGVGGAPSSVLLPPPTAGLCHLSRSVCTWLGLGLGLGLGVGVGVGVRLGLGVGLGVVY